MTKFLSPRKFCVLTAVLLLASGLRADPSPSPSLLPAPTPVPTALPAHPAPPGVLYLIEETAVPISGGLEGVPAGTEVKLLKDLGGKVLVSYKELEFSIWKTQVTNDLDTVAVVRKYSAGIEAADEATRQQREAAYVKQQRDQVDFLRSHPLATPTAPRKPTPAPTPTPTPTPAPTPKK